MSCLYVAWNEKPPALRNAKIFLYLSLLNNNCYFMSLWALPSVSLSLLLGKTSFSLKTLAKTLYPIP